MIYSNNFSVPTRIPHSQHRNHSLLVEKEAKACDANDRLLLPSSTRSVKRRISLLEKSRDWARRLITLHKPRRNTLSNEPNRTPFAEASKRSPPEIKPCSSSKQLHNAQKNFDEDGYLSPLEIKAKLDTIKRPAPTHPSQVTLSEPSHAPPVAKSQVIYRYHDPNISTPLPPPACVCPIGRRTPRTSFVSEFQKSLSIVDYIDDDVPDEIVKHDDDPLHSLKYLFDDERTPGSTLLPRRIPRRSTNVSSISTDSGYSDVPVSTTPKLIPIHLVSCTLLPVNPSAHDPMNARCFTCSCRPASSLSTTCLANHADRRVSPPTTRSYLYRQTLTHLSPAENGIATQCTCTKYHSTMTIYPPPLPPLPMSKNPAPKLNEYKEDYYQRPQKQRDNKRTTAKRRPNTADDLSSISRWYKPNLEREEVCDALQQADYGTFILRKSTTHADCYALSIKVPKFTHESNIVHYLIEKTMVNQAASYRIKGTVKQFPTLLSLLTHHSVMPEILPITLNLNESFSI